MLDDKAPSHNTPTTLQKIISDLSEHPTLHDTTHILETKVATNVNTEAFKRVIADKNRKIEMTQTEKLSRAAFLLLMLMLPIFGWSYLWRRVTNVKTGQILVKQDMQSHTTMSAEAGLHLLSVIYPYESAQIIDCPSVNTQPTQIGDVLIVHVPKGSGKLVSFFANGTTYILNEGLHIVETTQHKSLRDIDTTGSQYTLEMISENSNGCFLNPGTKTAYVLTGNQFDSIQLINKPTILDMSNRKVVALMPSNDALFNFQTTSNAPINGNEYSVTLKFAYSVTDPKKLIRQFCQDAKLDAPIQPDSPHITSHIRAIINNKVDSAIANLRTQMSDDTQAADSKQTMATEATIRRLVQLSPAQTVDITRQIATTLQRAGLVIQSTFVEMQPTCPELKKALEDNARSVIALEKQNIQNKQAIRSAEQEIKISNMKVNAKNGAKLAEAKAEAEATKIQTDAIVARKKAENAVDLDRAKELAIIASESITRTMESLIATASKILKESDQQFTPQQIVAILKAKFGSEQYKDTMIQTVWSAEQPSTMNGATAAASLQTMARNPAPRSCNGSEPPADQKQVSVAV